MENKYFIPEKEDLRIGYECEMFVFNTIKEESFWKKHVLTPFTLRIGIEDETKSYIRTPYLSQEQLEAEGWNLTDIPFDDDLKDEDVFKKAFEKVISENLWYTLELMENHQIQIQKRYYINQVSQIWKVVFEGECKCINQLKQIFKQIHITPFYGE